jgi:hypothetical protein
MKNHYSFYLVSLILVLILTESCWKHQPFINETLNYSYEVETGTSVNLYLHNDSFYSQRILNFHDTSLGIMKRIGTRKYKLLESNEVILKEGCFKNDGKRELVIIELLNSLANVMITNNENDTILMEDSREIENNLVTLPDSFISVNKSRFASVYNIPWSDTLIYLIVYNKFKLELNCTCNERAVYFINFRAMKEPRYKSRKIKISKDKNKLYETFKIETENNRTQKIKREYIRR